MSGGLVAGGSSAFLGKRANYGLIYNDIVFFSRECGKFKSDEVIRKCYARTIIVFTAFLVEAIANLFYEELQIKKEDCKLRKAFKKQYNENLPLPILKLIKANNILSQPVLTLDKVAGMRDLFLIRNSVIAHPKGRSIVCGTGVKEGVGQPNENKFTSYNKFKDFPYIYSEFDVVHAEKLFKETQDFLARYSELINKSRKLTQQSQQWLLDIFIINDIII